MLCIVIGQSGSGKTTFVKKHLLSTPYEYIDVGIPCTKDSNGKIALGKYGIGIRTEGTDTLAYNAATDIKRALWELKDKDIVLEGDRITSRPMFEYISLLGVEVKLYLITCSIKTSMKRLKSENSSITAKFVKATKTKSRNLFLEYGHMFNGEVVNTEEVQHGKY